MQVEINHPCRLTSTAVKISFPGMKSEVLVSFLGYKEPNLMFVNRCKESRIIEKSIPELFNGGMSIFRGCARARPRDWWHACPRVGRGRR